MAINYKSCPLKKRPIVFVDIEEPTDETFSTAHLQTEPLELTKYDEQPQDLSLKRKASDYIEDYVPPAKREYGLNLSKSVSHMMPAASPISYHNGLNTALLSPPTYLDNTTEYIKSTDIHLRDMPLESVEYTHLHAKSENPYQSAFVLAAGCNPMTAAWQNYQPTTTTSMFPSPATSIASSAASPCSAYSYQHITPPSSPSSDDGSEPEDLSVRNDIPLPALFHLFDEAPSSSNSASSYGSMGYAKSGDAAAAAKNYRFKCEKCSKMYSTSMGLSKHQQFHCPAAECNQEKKQHSCEECGKLYTTIGALKMHIRTHTLPCKCPICGKAFSRHWLLQGHIRTHTGEKPYKCPDCPRSFADRSNLRAHQQTHVDIKKYACKICNKSFSRMSLLNKHTSSNCALIVA